jgi:hypothetical protein
MGVISGMVTYSNGQPSGMSYVSAYFSGLSGGVTNKVQTDSQGRFMLTYTGDQAADIIYCDGREAAKNVRSGTNNLHIVTR